MRGDYRQLDRDFQIEQRSLVLKLRIMGIQLKINERHRV